MALGSEKGKPFRVPWRKQGAMRSYRNIINFLLAGLLTAAAGPSWALVCDHSSRTHSLEAARFCAQLHQHREAPGPQTRFSAADGCMSVELAPAQAWTVAAESGMPEAPHGMAVTSSHLSGEPVSTERAEFDSRGPPNGSPSLLGFLSEYPTHAPPRG